MHPVLFNDVTRAHDVLVLIVIQALLLIELGPVLNTSKIRSICLQYLAVNYWLRCDRISRRQQRTSNSLRGKLLSRVVEYTDSMLLPIGIVAANWLMLPDLRIDVFKWRFLLLQFLIGCDPRLLPLVP